MKLNVTSDERTETTVVSNLFIDEYMKDANDIQIKVYLYLLRTVNGGIAFGVSDIADNFNYSERDILRAFDYWEKRGVLSLEYDEGHLTGIRFLPLNGKKKKSAANSVATDREEVRKEMPSVSFTLVPDEEPECRFDENKTYSRDEIRSFKEDGNAAQIIFIAEQYLKRTLTMQDIQALYFIYDELKFTCEMTDYLLEYCIERGKNSFSYIKKVAINWAQSGITTPKQAKELAGTKYDKYVYTVLKALGNRNMPQPAEAAIVTRWHKTYDFSLDVIMEACNRTVIATDSHRLEYCDKILSNWKEKGVHHLADVSALDTKHKTARTKRESSKPNSFGQLECADYDFDELNKMLGN
jgi:DnaD/phage-associated family protein